MLKTNLNSELETLQNREKELRELIQVKERILISQASNRCIDLAMQTKNDISDFRSEIAEIESKILTIKNTQQNDTKN